MSSLVALLVLAAMQLSVHWANPALQILPSPLDSIVAASTAATMVCGLMVRIGAQVRRKQREILSALHQQRGAIEALARRIEAIEAAGVPQNGKVIELGTRIASKIVHD